MTRVLLEQYSELLHLFVYALARLSGLLITAPFFSSAAIPMRIRALLAVGLAALIAPLHQSSAIVRPDSLVDWSVTLAGETLVGLALGLGVLILFSGLQVAGQIVGQMSGLQLADAFDPNFNDTSSIFATVFHQVALAVFLLIGGHRHVLAALLDTFQEIPPGSAAVQTATAQSLVQLTSLSLSLGLRAAAPAMTALLIAVVVLSLVSRTLPQLNVMLIGFSINTMLTFAVLAISMGAVVWLVQDHVEPVIALLREAMLDTEPE